MEKAKANRFSGLFDEGEDKSSKVTKTNIQEAKTTSTNKKDKDEEKEYSKQSSNKEKEGFINLGKQEGYKKKDNYSKGRIEYVPKEGSGKRQHYKFPGSNDPIHPYDRKSGTGRGKEDPKEGYKGWGRAQDDIKEFEKGQSVTEKKEENLEEKKEEGKQNENSSQNENSKNESKEVEEKKEEKKEEEKEPEIPPITYAEYLKQKEEKRKNLPQHKVKPKNEQKLEGLLESKQEELEDKKAIKNYKPPEEFFVQKVVGDIELGTYIEADKPYSGNPNRPYKGGYKGKRDNPKGSKFEKKHEESKTITHDPSKEKKFVLNEDDFPPL